MVKKFFRITQLYLLALRHMYNASLKMVAVGSKRIRRGHKSRSSSHHPPLTDSQAVYIIPSMTAAFYKDESIPQGKIPEKKVLKLSEDH